LQEVFLAHGELEHKSSLTGVSRRFQPIMHNVYMD
jgi:hypothetical protein